MRLTESLHDSLYALSAEDRSTLWTSAKIADKYIIGSATFDADGNLFDEGYFTMNYPAVELRGIKRNISFRSRAAGY
ncbi:MAG: hypothetical protein ACOYMF_00505 [Bacteroidales bacterium]